MILNSTVSHTKKLTKIHVSKSKILRSFSRKITYGKLKDEKCIYDFEKFIFSKKTSSLLFKYLRFMIIIVLFSNFFHSYHKEKLQIICTMKNIVIAYEKLSNNVFFQKKVERKTSQNNVFIMKKSYDKILITLREFSSIYFIIFDNKILF